MASYNDPRYSKGVVVSAFAVLFAMIGLCIYLSASSLVRLKQITRLDGLGVRTRGEAYGRSINGGRSSEIYNIKYKFMVDGQYYSGVSPVSREDYNIAYIGSPTSITYLREDPKTSRATRSVDQEQDVSEIEILIVLVIGLLVIGYNLMIAAKKTRACRM